jgi:hypothetical protein
MLFNEDAYLHPFNVSGITLVTFNYSTTCISLLNTIIKAFEEVFPTFFDFQLENRALLLGPETAPASEVQIKAYERCFSGRRLHQHQKCRSKQML